MEGDVDICRRWQKTGKNTAKKSKEKKEGVSIFDVNAVPTTS